MSQYKYLIVNKENQQQNGIINAPDETAARQELNSLGFSILEIKLATAEDVQNNEALEENDSSESIQKFEFEAIDKNGKKIVGTIQGEDVFSTYKRLLNEYQFNVSQLYLENLSDKDKEKARLKGVDDLKDQLLEEKLAAEQAVMKNEQDQIAFKEKQEEVKHKVDFVLQKINEMLDNYNVIIDPAKKAKIKYYVDKILRIRNSTNLDYILSTCTEMLEFIQNEELFLHQYEKNTEKTQLNIEAKSMVLELNRIQKPKQKDIFVTLHEWRKKHITDDEDPDLGARIMDILITPIIGNLPENQKIMDQRQEIADINIQIKQYLQMYFTSKMPEQKKEIKKTLANLWQNRKNAKQKMKRLRQEQEQILLENNEKSSVEILEEEIFNLSLLILIFYLIYYFLTIYLNTKVISFIPDTKFNDIFHTTFIKYFFISLFFFVCFLGIKIEFFEKKKYATPFLFIVFLLSTSIIILNF